MGPIYSAYHLAVEVHDEYGNELQRNKVLINII